MLVLLVLPGRRARGSSRNSSSGRGDDAASSGQGAPQGSVAGPGAGSRRTVRVPPGRGPDAVLERRRHRAPLGQRRQRRRAVGGGVGVADDDDAAVVGKLPAAALLLFLLLRRRRQVHRSRGDGCGSSRGCGLGERVRGAQQVLAVEVLLRRGGSKLKLVAVVVVDSGSDVARRGGRSREGQRGAVGAAGEGAPGDGAGAVVGLS